MSWRECPECGCDIPTDSYMEFELCPFCNLKFPNPDYIPKKEQTIE